MLLTNGCSFVWGDELKDYDAKPPAHWHLTFTHQLAEKLDCDYEILARCGSGNDKIFRDTIDYLMSDRPKPTHVVIMWSAWARQEVAENHDPGVLATVHCEVSQNMTQYSPVRTHYLMEDKVDAVKAFYDCIDTRTFIIQHLAYMKAIQLLCDQMNIKVVQGVFHKRNWENVLHYMKPGHRDRHWGPWMDHVIQSLNTLRPECKVGMDNFVDMFTLAGRDFTIKEYGHPDEDTHAEFANLLHHIFKTRCNK